MTGDFPHAVNHLFGINLGAGFSHGLPPGEVLSPRYFAENAEPFLYRNLTHGVTSRVYRNCVPRRVHNEGA